MAASRRRRFERGEPEHPIGPLDTKAVLEVAKLGMATVPQVAGLLGWTERAASNHLRNAYDHGYLERSGITRPQLVVSGGSELLFGSAPIVYSLTREGLRSITDAQLLAASEIADVPQVTPKSLFVAHDLLIRDVRVWLTILQRAYPSHRGLCEWVHGSRCAVELGRSEYPRQCRPDARFTYGLREKTLAAFVEADRGTETSPVRWEEKVAQYVPLLSTGLVAQVTGQELARVLVFCLDAARRDWIATTLNRSLPKDLRDRFWLCERSVMAAADLAAPVWRVPGVSDLLPLVPPQFL
ncbi:MAG TPA: replication-relaxation family protein [Chthonomonadaceae bacterium]|nr:replication-relaxation family protein [Chthonomonadaceae bacterium]